MRSLDDEVVKRELKVEAGHEGRLEALVLEDPVAEEQRAED